MPGEAKEREQTIQPQREAPDEHLRAGIPDHMQRIYEIFARRAGRKDEASISLARPGPVLPETNEPQ